MNALNNRIQYGNLTLIESEQFLTDYQLKAMYTVLLSDGTTTICNENHTFFLDRVYQLKPVLDQWYELTEKCGTEPLESFKVRYRGKTSFCTVAEKNLIDWANENGQSIEVDVEDYYIKPCEDPTVSDTKEQPIMFSGTGTPFVMHPAEGPQKWISRYPVGWTLQNWVLIGYRHTGCNTLKHVIVRTMRCTEDMVYATHAVFRKRNPNENS